MGILALIVGILGVLCGAMGVVTSFDILDEPVISKLGDLEFLFWFMTGGILLLSSIALSVGYKSNEVD